MITRIAISTPFYQRHALTRASAAWNRKVFEEAGFEVTLCLVGSEGKASKAVADDVGAVYEDVPNDPLGYKFNRSVQLAREREIDFVVWVGSDDFISREYVALVKQYIERYDQALDVISNRSCYLWQHGDDEVFYAQNFTTDVGMVLSANYLERRRWTCFNDEANEKLDVYLKQRVFSRAHTWICLSDCRAAPIIDVKTDVGMYSIRRMRRVMHLERSPAAEVLAHFEIPDELKPDAKHRSKPKKEDG